MSDVHVDPVHELLEQRGCEGEIIEAGLEGLVTGWEAVSARVADGYDRGLDEYLTDLDSRQLLEDALSVATPEQCAAAEKRVRAADAQIRTLVDSVEECLWGAKVADSEGWTADRHWWYFSLPREPGPALQADLGSG